jgi:putative membrane protein
MDLYLKEVSMLRRIYLPLLALSFAASAAFAQGKVSEGDTKVMKNLAEANLAEIEAGKLAADKAKSPEVKEFGNRMVKDHTAILDELKQLAQEQGVELPGSAGMGDRARTVALRTKSGEDFDKAYMADMVKDHQKDVQETAELAKKVDDPRLKSAIEKAPERSRSTSRWRSASSNRPRPAQPPAARPASYFSIASMAASATGRLKR